MADELLNGITHKLTDFANALQRLYATDNSGTPVDAYILVPEYTAFLFSVSRTFAENLSITGQATGGSSVKAFSAIPTFDFNNGNSIEMVLTGNVTSLTLSNKVNGGSYLIWLIQDSTGGRTIPTPDSTFGTNTTNSVVDFNTDASGGNLINVNVSPSGKTVWTLEVYTP